MESDVEKISADIAGTVKLIMDPFTPSTERKKALEMLDNFKDTSPICAKCGFFLSTKNHSPTVRHCGFHLIDNYIKLHWNEIDLEQKLWIKNSIIETIASGTESVLKEEVYVKDAVSRIVVELIKREWPQHWPSLMEELHNLCIMGDKQTELVLLIFSRLADDIVQFQNVPDVRRREIYKTLCSHLNFLFAFFWETLSKNTEVYISNENSGIKTESALQTSRIIQVTLETLYTFVEWVPITYLTEIPLIKLLSKLLEFENLRMSAAICLFNIFERKGKPEERRELLVFFEETALFKEISELDEITLLSERHYLFLGELCKCFVSLTINLCSSMASFAHAQNSIKEPQSLPLFLNCALLFVKHPSLVLCQRVQALWLNILRSAQLSSSSSVLNLIPTLLKYQTEKLLKVGYPSKTDSPSCKFSLVEFDSDDDFELLFNRLRADVAEVLRLIMNIQPQIAFSFCKMLLTSLATEGKGWKDIIGNSCPEVERKLYWEAMVTYMEAICGTLIKKDLVVSREFAKDAFEMIAMCKNLASEDPTVLSYALSCISSLFFFYSFSPESCSEAIDKIFSYFIVFPKDGPFAREVMNLRRHASSLLIKLCCNHSTLLSPLFDNICERIQSLFLIEDCLTTFDKCALLEAMMILSNHFCDYEKQSKFLKAVLSPIIQIWFSPATTEGIKCSGAFINFIGADKPQPPSVDNVLSKDACDLMYGLNVVRACVKRCVYPSDPEAAKKGNFVHPLSDSIGTLVYRNPAAQFIIPILEKVIQLFRTLNGLYDPLEQKRIDPSYSNILGISEGERNVILGLSSTDISSQQKTPSDRLKIFIQNLYEGCLFTLGNSVENLGIDFYTIPDLPGLLKESILHKIEYMPAFNLKYLIRLFLRPFFLWCPPSAYNELMLVLQGLCPFMLQKLSTVWEKFKLRYGTSIGYEEQQTETEEILEDQLNRILSKEYIQFLDELLHKQKVSSLNGDSMEDGLADPPSNQSKSLTELGLKIIRTESVRAVFICTAFDSLRWLDTTTNIRALHLCESLFHKMLEDGLIQKLPEANYLLQSVLYGLQELGEHEANLALLLSFSITVYDNLRHRFPDIRVTLMSSVDCNENSIRHLDEVLTRNSQKTKNDKQKKDAFKNVVSKIIGTNLGQHHKKEVVIKNLPPLLSFKPKENSSLLDVEANDDIGICNLFAANGKY